MYKLLKKVFEVGVITEEVRPDESFRQLGEKLQRRLKKQYQGSVAIRQVDAGSCNGCELEIHGLNNPYYNIEQYGVHFVASPRHADILLVTGPVTAHMAYALRRTYNAMPKPRWVIASGDCAACGGEYGESYALHSGVSKIIPVDLTIPGCPPSPHELAQGLITLLESAQPEQQ